MAETTTEKKTARKKEPRSFEEAAARLNTIVSALETGTAPLDESLALYEEGIALVRYCNARLDAAEQKVKVLTRTADGTIAEKDFLINSNAPVSEEGTTQK